MYLFLLAYSSEQSNALSKYEGIWASYKAKYESKEKVRLLRSKEEQLHTVQEHSTLGIVNMLCMYVCIPRTNITVSDAQLEKQILQLEQIIQAMKQNQGGHH